MVWSGYAVLMSGKTDSIKLNNNPGCLPGSTFVYSEVFKLDFSSASLHVVSSSNSTTSLSSVSICLSWYFFNRCPLTLKLTLFLSVISTVPYGYTVFTTFGPYHLDLSLPGCILNLELNSNTRSPTLKSLSPRSLESCHFILYRVDGGDFVENYGDLWFIVINNPFWKDPVLRAFGLTVHRLVGLKSLCDVGHTLEVTLRL
ncbi:hypothetical protein Tco_0646857 [Tanacetum coccineum]